MDSRICAGAMALDNLSRGAGGHGRRPLPPGSGLLGAADESPARSASALRRLDCETVRSPPRLSQLCWPRPGLGEWNQWRVPLEETLVPAGAASFQPSGRPRSRLFQAAGPLIGRHQARIGVEPLAGGPALAKAGASGLKVSAGAGRERLCPRRPLCQWRGGAAPSQPMVPVGAVRAENAWGRSLNARKSRTRAWCRFGGAGDPDGWRTTTSSPPPALQEGYCARFMKPRGSNGVFLEGHPAQAR